MDVLPIINTFFWFGQCHDLRLLITKPCTLHIPYTVIYRFLHDMFADRLQICPRPTLAYSRIVLLSHLIHRKHTFCLLISQLSFLGVVPSFVSYPSLQTLMEVCLCVCMHVHMWVTGRGWRLHGRVVVKCSFTLPQNQHPRQKLKPLSDFATFAHSW